MSDAVPTPADIQADAVSERLANVLLGIERALAHTFRLVPLAVDGRPVVGVHLDGARHLLSPDDIRLLVRCLEWDGGGKATRLLSSLFLSAACDAEALACPTASARRAALLQAGAA
ncbi:MAG: hypothetical protein KF842_06935 [Caulobacter sp.]|nr:hypothetical protein [Caulobacter sp.]